MLWYINTQYSVSESSPVMVSRVAPYRPAFWKSKNIVRAFKFLSQRFHIFIELSGFQLKRKFFFSISHHIFRSAFRSARMSIVRLYLSVRIFTTGFRMWSRLYWGFTSQIREYKKNRSILRVSFNNVLLKLGHSWKAWLVHWSRLSILIARAISVSLEAPIPKSSKLCSYCWYSFEIL